MLAGMKPKQPCYPARLLFPAVLFWLASPAESANASFKGTYNGLIYSEEQPVPERFGYFKIKISDNGHLTGNMRVGDRHASFKGKFNSQGTAYVSILSHPDNYDCYSSYPYAYDCYNQDKKLNWTLSLQLINESQQITGQVTFFRGYGWSSTLLGDRAGYDRSTPPAPQAAQYTFVIPGNPEDQDSPGGDGCGTVTVDGSGNVLVKGLLADGSKITQSAVLSASGTWPLFVPLYGGQGMLVGWVHSMNLEQADFVGELNWVRPSHLSSGLYPAGFAKQRMVLAARYVVPTSQTNFVPNFTNGTIVFHGGNLISSFTNSVTLGSNGRVIENGGNSLKLNLRLSTGLFSGTVQEPGTGKTLTFNGAFLQNQNAGFGFFLDNDRSGEVTISADQ